MRFIPLFKSQNSREKKRDLASLTVPSYTYNVLKGSLDNFECQKLPLEDIDRSIPGLPPQGSPLAERARAYLAECERRLTSFHEQHYHSGHLVFMRSRMIDRLIAFLFEECSRQVSESYTGYPASLAAQGGYGRQEMNIHSDIDLIFLYPKKKGAYIETLTEKILYLLWDLGLEVGFATRTVTECKKLFLEDLTIMTSLLDARFLCGNAEAFEQLTSEIRRLLKNTALQKKLIGDKLAEKEARIAKNGGSVFVLEPNVKESAGTLRDIHLPCWIAKIQARNASYEDFAKEGLISEEEYQGLVLARDFLWRVRNDIHIVVGKKVDLLTFHRQEAIAPKMGFAASGGILAVEKFMQTYYKLAYQVASVSGAVIRRMTVEASGLSRFFRKLKTVKLDENFRVEDGHINLRRRESIKDNPQLMMAIYKHVQERGLPIHPETKDYLRTMASGVDESFRKNPEMTRLFRSMLNCYENLGETLLQMHDTHFIDEWLPEFKKLRCRVQHDVYHIYTIDTHSIFAVDELGKLARGDYNEKFPLYAKVLREIRHPEILTFGVLLHDIGKGEGGSHSVRGARIAGRITVRLGYSEAEQKEVEFLILSHLLMPHLSQRRDLEDPELVIQFARSMGGMDRLNMLFLLTWADIRAIGPEAWTDWKGVLLAKLYEKTRDVITRGEFSRELTGERVARVKDSLVSRIGDSFPREEYQHYLSLMPSRYFFAAGDKDIERHFLLCKQSEREDIVSDFRFLPDKNLNEAVIYTLNAPQVFSLVTGVMLAYGVNIMGADVFQTTDGRLLLVLLVSDANGKPFEDAAFFEKVKSSLQGVLFGQLKVDELIARRQVPDYLAKKPVQKAESRIVIDNDVSAYYTVIDIYAHDRLGLLYDITRTLNQLGCYVDVSKISTKVEQVTDVFYVKDIFGHKITAPDKLKTIKKALQGVISNVA